MIIDELTIGQAKELAALLAPQARAQRNAIDHGLKIVVLDRGFIYIGLAETDGEWVIIRNAHNIRRWGSAPLSEAPAAADDAKAAPRAETPAAAPQAAKQDRARPQA